MKHVLKIIVLAGFALFIVEKTFRFFINLQPEPTEKESEDIQDEKPNNGVYKQLDKNGNLLSIQYYNDGARDSTWTYFYPDGSIRSMMSYKNNLLDGRARHYSQEGGLIYEEHYKQGKLVEVHIKNDSLYKYKVQLATHGKILYQNTCTPCHATVPEKAYTNLKWVRDSLQPDKLMLDSLHMYLADSTGNSREMIPADHNVRQLNRFDMDALHHYLQIEKDKSRQLPFRGIKSLKDKPKTVFIYPESHYLEDISAEANVVESPNQVSGYNKNGMP